MTHYRSNPRDIAFWLFEVLDRSAVLGTSPYEDLDADTVRSILAEVDRLAREQLAASFVSGDRNPPTLDPETRTVTTDDGFRAGVRAWMESGFWRLRLPVELGGSGAPSSVVWAVDELLLGANPALWVYTSIATAARVIHDHGTERDRALAQHMVDRGWTATMVITEPDAGSDVGHARTRARPNDDGTWNITGTKRFITAGDHDLAENIVHLVLARPDNAEETGRLGTKGLSLFLVPKFHIDPVSGELTGERNGVEVAAVEHKMGMTASATCELVLGGDRPAVGWLLGETHDGIAQMFHVIEDARMMVGTKAMATMSTGYLHALEHARTRLQGSRLRDLFDRTAGRVPIVEHADVRRSLLTQKATAEGLRGLVLYTASVQDSIAIGQNAGEDVEGLRRLNDMLLPIVKGYGSERTWNVLSTESLQTLGGSGYLRDHPLEQYVRDAKIDTLYEGTTAIQGLDLFLRKVARDGGATVRALLDEIGAFDPGQGRPGGDEAEELSAAAALLIEGVEQVGELVDLLLSAWQAANAGARVPLGDEIDLVGLHASRLLYALGDVVVAWLLLRAARSALDLIATALPADRPFLQGKLEVASFFARTTLPRLEAEVAVVRASDVQRVMSFEAAIL